MSRNFRVPSRFDPLERRTLLSTYIVTTTADSGPQSFRQAILDANLNPGTDTINFAIGSGAATIAPTSALPEFTGPVILDGASQPGYAGMPLIEISGASAGQVEGLVLRGGNSTVKGLVVNRFYGSGIIVKDLGNNIFENNFIGTDRTGLIKQGNRVHGMLIMCDFNRVGGTSAAQRNVISGNGVLGLFLLQASDNIVQGNYIGAGIDGLTAVPNMSGADTQEGGGNIFGGTAPGAGNLISGNTLDGLIIYSSSNYNTIQGNLIGTDSTGTIAVPNGNWGIECQGGHNLIGGTIPAARNILSGNGTDGLNFYLNTAQYNLAQGNFIGTDITGTRAIGNTYQGVSFSGDTDVNLNAPGPVNNIIGGTTPAERNIISGNRTGVGIFNRTRGNFVTGNWIGTDVTGTVAIPNETGINIFNDSTGNTIGGTAPGAGNVIANSLIDGINVGCHDTVIQGNLIGTDPTGTLAMPNGGHAILTIFCNRTTIGGPTAAARNIIANSGDCAIKFAAGAQHLVQNNYIGTDITGAVAMGNATAAVWFDGAALSTVANNLIANNGQFGIIVGGDGAGNRFTANSISNNGALGIDLAGDGVTPNAPGTRTGPNKLQNYPVISSAASDHAQTTIAGALNSIPQATFTLEFFSSPAADPTGHGEGRTFLGSATVTTDAAGDASFNVTFNVSTPAGQVITATATASDGSTSEFSAARTVVAVTSVAGRYVFYNSSYFDGNNAAANADDDNAIDTEKSALLPGQKATYANYTGYSKGINGIMIDVSGLANAEHLSPSDFVFRAGNSTAPSAWPVLAVAPEVTVRTAAGAGGTDRITLIWPNNTIRKQWLQVTLRATANTGLAAPDVFYFGNAVGETGNSALNAFVDATDFVGVRDHPRNFLDRAPVTYPYDLDKDSFVDGTDLVIARDNTNNFLTALKLIAAPAAPPASAAPAGSGGGAATAQATSTGLFSTTRVAQTPRAAPAMPPTRPAMLAARRFDPDNDLLGRSSMLPA